MTFDIKDVRFDLIRINTGGMQTGSFPTIVKVTHLPTGISVTSSVDRHAYRNKAIALTQLQEKVEAHYEKSNPS